MKKGDYIKHYGEIGLVNKVKGRAAYVKFPDTRATSFDVVDIQDLKKDLSTHNGKTLYLLEG